MRYPLHQIDAFTTRRFGGNPAAVMLLDRWLPDDVMLAIAAENNLAETAFVLADTGEDPIPLRWFAPTVEIDLCGHATLATGHVLFERDPGRGDVIRFATMSGTLSVTRRDGALELDLPARPAESVPVTDGANQRSGIGSSPESARTNAVSARLFSAAIASITSSGNQRSSNMTAAGLPPKRRVVKASIWWRG